MQQQNAVGIFSLLGLLGITHITTENMHLTRSITTDQSIQGGTSMYFFPEDTTLTGGAARVDIAVTGKLDMTHVGIRALPPAPKHGPSTTRQVGSMVFGQWTQV